MKHFGTFEDWRSSEKLQSFCCKIWVAATCMFLLKEDPGAMELICRIHNLHMKGEEFFGDCGCLGFFNFNSGWFQNQLDSEKKVRFQKSTTSTCFLPKKNALKFEGSSGWFFCLDKECMQDKGRPPVAPAQEQLENRPHDTTHQQWTINGWTFHYISYAGFDICVWVPLTLLLLPRKPTVWVSQGRTGMGHISFFHTLLQLWHQYHHLRITIPTLNI